MMLEGKNNGSAIGWVRADLDESLGTVRERLEALFETPMEAVQWRDRRLFVASGGP